MQYSRFVIRNMTLQILWRIRHTFASDRHHVKYFCFPVFPCYGLVRSKNQRQRATLKINIFIGGTRHYCLRFCSLKFAICTSSVNKNNVPRRWISLFVNKQFYLFSVVYIYMEIFFYLLHEDYRILKRISNFFFIGWRTLQEFYKALEAEKLLSISGNCSWYQEIRNSFYLSWLT